MIGADFLQLSPAAAPARGLTGWLADAIRAAIMDGRLRAGAPLPATRLLAGDLGVSRGVIVEAYQRLADEGLVSARSGAGTRVLGVPRPAAGAATGPGTAPGPGTATGPGTVGRGAVGAGVAGPLPGPLPVPAGWRERAEIDLSPGVPDLSGFPRAAWMRAERAVLEQASVTELGYGDPRGSLALRTELAGWLARTRGLRAGPGEIIVTTGVAQALALLARVLRARGLGEIAVEDPGSRGARDDLAYWGLRPVPVPVDDGWHLDLARVDPADAARALVLWLNDPSNPTGVTATPAQMRDAVEWARARGVLVASDECYAEFTYDRDGVATAPVTALDAGTDGVLAVHSLSKRSNMAGMRSGFVAGDRALVGYLGEVRKHGGLMMPAPVQAATVAALGDDEHVTEQRDRYARRRAVLLPALEARGLVHDGGSSTFYLWLRDPDRSRDGWAIADDLATTGLVVAPGDFYGDASTDHVRVALTLTDDQVALVADRATAGINA